MKQLSENYLNNMHAEIILLLGSPSVIKQFLTKVYPIERRRINFKILINPRDAEGWICPICILLPGYKERDNYQEILTGLKRSSAIILTAVSSPSSQS